MCVIVSVAVDQVTGKNFGVLIATLLPGFVTLWGVSYFSPTLRSWLAATPSDAPTIGGFLYVTLASVGAGMTVSAFRFQIIDRIHHATGIRQPPWDFSRLRDSVTAYEVLNEIHYKYYVFHANILLAIVFTTFARRTALDDWSLSWFDAGLAVLCAVYFLTSRDNLKKYYTRVAKLLGTESSSLDDSRLKSGL